MFVTCSKSHLPQQNDVDELTPRLFLGPATARRMLEAGISADPARLWGSCCEGAEAADHQMPWRCVRFVALLSKDMRERW